MKKVTKILIIDDEKGIRESLSEILLDEGYQTVLAEDANVARKIIDSDSIDIILLDIWMPDCDGITLLKELKGKKKIKQPVIMMSGHGTINTAVEATKYGALDFLEKPISLHKVLKVIHEAVLISLEFPPLSIEFLKHSKNLKILKLFSCFDKNNHHHHYFQTLITESLLNIIKEISNFENPVIKIINQSEIKSIDDADLFLSENNNSILIFDKLTNFSQQSLVMYKILIDKAAKFNYEVYVVDKELLNSEDAIKYEIEKFNHIDFNIFNEDDDDDIIETSKKILSFYLEKLSNKIFKEFDITFLNKIRSDDNCYDLIYLDKVIRQSLKESDSDLITEDDFNKIQTVNDGNKEKNLDDNGLFNHLYKLELREAREHFDKIYLQYHLKNKISMKDLSKLTGLERTHLYRKLKQLGLKIS